MEPRGIRNNNPLNIRKGNSWKGERPAQKDPVFEEFESIEYGFRAALLLIRNYITGKNSMYRKYETIDAIIRRWAPPIENATENYVNFVADGMQVSRYHKIHWSNRAEVCNLVRHMAFVECGRWFDIEVIQSAYDMV